MLAHYRMASTRWTGDVAQLNACFIAALVTGRLFLNVLGIGKRRVGDNVALDRFSPQDSDVMVDDLGCLLIDPAALPAADRDLFLDFLNMADKAAAHFTIPMNHDWAKTREVIHRIHYYLKLNLYDHTGRAFQDATP